MPNLHHLLADLSPFGQDNPNHIFVPIDEPHGFHRGHGRTIGAIPVVQIRGEVDVHFTAIEGQSNHRAGRLNQQGTRSLSPQSARNLGKTLRRKNCRHALNASVS